MALHLSADLPPLDVVSSVRGVVFRDGTNDVLVCRDADGRTHVTPGGRREPADAPPDVTLRRHVTAEAGCTIGEAPRPLGFIHYRHLNHAASHGRAEPLPDFATVVYVARATGGPTADARERTCTFRPVKEALHLPLEAASRYFLLAAVGEAVIRHAEHRREPS